MKTRTHSSEKKTIAIVAMPDTTLINLAGPADVFSRASMIIEELTGKPGYEIILLSPDPSMKTVTASSGISVVTPLSYKTIKTKIDTLLVAGYPSKGFNSEGFIRWLKKAPDKVRRIGSVCRGAFALAEAGLLKNKKASTHWKSCRLLQDCYPETTVEQDSLYVKDGQVYTSGGVTSGMDLALAMVEEDYGKDIALKVARMMVLFLRRPGNQLQFSDPSEQPEPDYQPVVTAQKWIASHLKEHLTVELLADKCAMSPRNFARVFLRETQLTPGKYIEKLRLEAARKQLENTSWPLERIAYTCGLGSPDTMRRLFLRHLKTTPSMYRHSFRTSL